MQTAWWIAFGVSFIVVYLAMRSLRFLPALAVLLLGAACADAGSGTFTVNIVNNWANNQTFKVSNANNGGEYCQLGPIPLGSTYSGAITVTVPWIPHGSFYSGGSWFGLSPDGSSSSGGVTMTVNVDSSVSWGALAQQFVTTMGYTNSGILPVHFTLYSNGVPVAVTTVWSGDSISGSQTNSQFVNWTWTAQGWNQDIVTGGNGTYQTNEVSGTPPNNGSTTQSPGTPPFATGSPSNAGTTAATNPAVAAAGIVQAVGASGLSLADTMNRNAATNHSDQEYLAGLLRSIETNTAVSAALAGMFTNSSTNQFGASIPDLWSAATAYAASVSNTVWSTRTNILKIIGNMTNGIAVGGRPSLWGIRMPTNLASAGKTLFDGSTVNFDPRGKPLWRGSSSTWDEVFNWWRAAVIFSMGVYYAFKLWDDLDRVLERLLIGQKSGGMTFTGIAWMLGTVALAVLAITLAVAALQNLIWTWFTTYVDGRNPISEVNIIGFNVDFYTCLHEAIDFISTLFPLSGAIDVLVAYFTSRLLLRVVYMGTVFVLNRVGIVLAGVLLTGASAGASTVHLVNASNLDGYVAVWCAPSLGGAFVYVKPGTDLVVPADYIQCVTNGVLAGSQVDVRGNGERWFMVARGTAGMFTNPSEFGSGANDSWEGGTWGLTLALMVFFPAAIIHWQRRFYARSAGGD